MERRQRKLLSTAVPSVFAWSAVESDSAVSRRLRFQRRRSANPDVHDILNNMSIPVETSQCEIDIALEVVCEESGNAVSVEHEDVESKMSQTDCSFVSSQCISTQTVNKEVAHFLCFEQLHKDEQLLHYYTGLESAKKLVAVFATLGPAVNHLNYHRTKTVDFDCISPINQFILMLAKLRQNLDYLPLSKLCGVSEYTAQNIFITWVNFCSMQWGEINVWPERDLTLFHAPEDFKLKFPTTRVIVDGTEIPIQKPSNPMSQRATFSSYKNRNTAKVIVGSTPGGLISYLSPAYGGSASDRQIIERSPLSNMCDPGDSVMADKGFNVQDLFATNDVTVNIPTFFRKKNRMSGRQVIADRKISSKRVHIERIIGLMKTYKILTVPLPSSATRLASHII